MPSIEDRKFFRIIDFIGLSYRPINEEEYKTLKLASRYSEVPSIDALSEVDQQIQMLLSKLRIKNPDVAELGKMLDKKIQLVLENSDLGEILLKRENIPQMQVDISACGIAFPALGPLDVGQFLELNLVLQSGKQHLILLGRVVASDTGADSLNNGNTRMSHVIRVEFLDISEQVQEFLIQYFVKRQGTLIKAGQDGGNEILFRQSTI